MREGEAERVRSEAALIPVKRLMVALHADVGKREPAFRDQKLTADPTG